MKLQQLQEVGYSTNYYAVEWCDETGECSGFVGPTQARVGTYQVTGELNDMFKPDYETYHDTVMGFIYVASKVDKAKKEMKFGIRPWHVHEFDVQDQTRTKFGKLIGKSPDIEYYEDPSVPAYLHEARYSGEHPLITKIKDAINHYKKTTIQVEVSMDEARDLISTELGEPKAYPAYKGSLAQYEWTLADPIQAVGYKKQLIVSLTDQRWHAVVHIMPSFY